MIVSPSVFLSSGHSRGQQFFICKWDSLGVALAQIHNIRCKGEYSRVGIEPWGGLIEGFPPAYARLTVMDVPNQKHGHNTWHNDDFEFRYDNFVYEQSTGERLEYDEGDEE